MKLRVGRSLRSDLDVLIRACTEHRGALDLADMGHSGHRTRTRYCPYYCVARYTGTGFCMASACRSIQPGTKRNGCERSPFGGTDEGVHYRLSGTAGFGTDEPERPVAQPGAFVPDSPALKEVARLRHELESAGDHVRALQSQQRQLQQELETEREMKQSYFQGACPDQYHAVG
eukprot:2122533-Rhodomonas_salina.2